MNRYLVLCLLLFGVRDCCTFAQSARIQIIHNSADPTVEFIDVYVNQHLQFDDVRFRTSTEVIDVDLSSPLVIAFAPRTSVSHIESFFIDTVDLQPDGNYAMVVSGVLIPASFATNTDPNAIPINLSLVSCSGIRDAATASDKVDVLAFHGATDAPSVDVFVNSDRLFEKLSFGGFSTYQTLSATTTAFGIAPVGLSPISAFKAELADFQGQAVILIASGFLNPSSNQNGPVNGLFIVKRSKGPFVMLPPTQPSNSASVQLIHNAADPLLTAIDVYLGPLKILDDFKFRSATKFLDLPKNTALTVSVAPANSTTVADAVASLSYSFGPGRYVVVATGVMDTTKFFDNPDVRAPSIKFTSTQINNIKPNATSPSEVDAIFFHGVTDGIPVDLYLDGSTKLGSDIIYTGSTPYTSIAADKYLFGLAQVGNPVYKQYYGNLQPMAGKSIVIVSSGFEDPNANQNGQRIGLYAALPEGGDLIEFPEGTTSVKEKYIQNSVQFWPNPCTDYLEIMALVPERENVCVTIFDVIGTSVMSTNFGNIPGGSLRHTIPTEALTSGSYKVVLQVGEMNKAYPLLIVH